MATRIVNIEGQSLSLKELVALVHDGTEVLLMEGETPLARIVPIEAATSGKRIAGLHRGAMQASEDFDEPLPESFWLGES